MSCMNASVHDLHHCTKLDVHRTHTPRCEVKKIIALWRMQRLGDMILDQCKDKVPAKLTSHELLLSVR